MPLRMSVLNVGRYTPERLRHLAQFQEECGYETFWCADERFFRDVYASLTLVALHTRHIQVGIDVEQIIRRFAYEMMPRVHTLL